jgi:ATP-dependent RNA helicase DDX31/DBP7
MVSLISLLTDLHNQTSTPRKTVVFFSSCNSVDFHYQVFGKCQPQGTLHILVFDRLSAGVLSNDEMATPKNPCLSALFGAKATQTRVFKLHGNIPHAQRVETFTAFSNASTSSVLLCTDVAARGLDLRITTAIQYDPPTASADYVHRAGRTARIGQEGTSILFLRPSEVEYVSVLDQKGMVLKERRVNDMLSRGVGMGKPFNRDVEDLATKCQLAIENFVASDPKVHPIDGWLIVAGTRSSRCVCDND